MQAVAASEFKAIAVGEGHRGEQSLEHPARMKIIQTDVFTRWFERLSDRMAKAIITERLARLASGAPCDIQNVGANVQELRIHYGPGYRLYFTRQGAMIVVLLAGGTKATQGRDILRARSLARYWRQP